MLRLAFLVATLALTSSGSTLAANSAANSGPVQVNAVDSFDFGGVDDAITTDSMSPQRALLGGDLRLEPLLPGGGGTSTSLQFQLTAAVGQSIINRSNDSRVTLRSGFWTPADAVGVDRIFRDSFE